MARSSGKKSQQKAATESANGGPRNKVHDGLKAEATEASGAAHSSTEKKRKSMKDENPITWFAALTTYLGYSILILFGHLRDFVGNLLGNSRYLATVPPKV